MGAHAECSSGVCVVSSCASTFADCDADAVNGCETSLDLDPLHCGACSNHCAVDEYCLSGACEPTARLVYAACGVTCILERTGSLNCAGSNAFGLLGTPHIPDSTALITLAVPPLRDFAPLGTVACGVTTVGDEVWCWGSNDNGVVSTPATHDILAPRVALVGSGPIGSIGGAPAFAVISQPHELLIWGANSGGALGAEIDAQGRGHVAVSAATIVGRGLAAAACAASADDVLCSGTFVLSDLGMSNLRVDAMSLPLAGVRWMNVQDHGVEVVTVNGETWYWSAINHEIMRTDDGPPVLMRGRGNGGIVERTFALSIDGRVREFATGSPGGPELVHVHEFASPAVWLDSRCGSACIVRRDGVVECIGANRSGELLRGYSSEHEIAFAPVATP